MDLLQQERMCINHLITLLLGKSRASAWVRASGVSDAGDLQH